MVVTLENIKDKAKVKIRKESVYYDQFPDRIGIVDLTNKEIINKITWVRVHFGENSNVYKIDGKHLDLEFVNTIHELWT